MDHADRVLPTVSIAEECWFREKNMRVLDNLVPGGVSATELVKGGLRATAAVVFVSTTFARFEVWRDLAQLCSLSLLSLHRELAKDIPRDVNEAPDLVHDGAKIIMFSPGDDYSMTALYAGLAVWFVYCIAFCGIAIGYENQERSSRKGWLEPERRRTKRVCGCCSHICLVSTVATLTLPSMAGIWGIDFMMPKYHDGAGMYALILLFPALLFVCVQCCYGTRRLANLSRPRITQEMETDSALYSKAIAESVGPFKFVITDLKLLGIHFPQRFVRWKFLFVSTLGMGTKVLPREYLWIAFALASVESALFALHVAKKQPFLSRRLTHVLVAGLACVALVCLSGAAGLGAVMDGRTVLFLAKGLCVISIVVGPVFLFLVAHRSWAELVCLCGHHRGQLSHGVDGLPLVASHVTELKHEVHKRWWRSSLDQLLLFGDDFGVPEVAKTNALVMAPAHRDLVPYIAPGVSHTTVGDHEPRPVTCDVELPAVTSESNRSQVTQPSDSTHRHTDARAAHHTTLGLRLRQMQFRHELRNAAPLDNHRRLFHPQCPPYLTEFNGSIGERHLENTWLLEYLGADTYIREVESRVSDRQAPLAECISNIAKTFSAVDMCWSVSLQGQVFFGKAVLLPFPLAILFQFDDDDFALIKRDSFARYVQMNTTPGVLAARERREKLRALEGQTVTFNHTGRKTKSKVRYVTESYRNADGQWRSRQVAQTYNVSVIFTYSTGVLHIEKQGTARNTFGHGFEVCLQLIDGEGVDNEGMSWFGESLEVGHDVLGINSAFDDSGELQKLFSVNQDVIDAHIGSVRSDWQAYRDACIQASARKEATLSYEFISEVYLASTSSVDELVAMFANHRMQSISTGQLSESTVQYLRVMVQRWAEITSETQHMVWFVFWHDFWLMNRHCAAVMNHRLMFDPCIKASIANSFSRLRTQKNDVKRMLVRAGVRTFNGKLGLLRDKTLNVLWEALDQCQTSATLCQVHPVAVVATYSNNAVASSDSTSEP